jgi:ABC-type polysaccharide/polyol phosphate export permease
MVPWVLFSSSITDMTECLVTNMNLVTKIYFPREILPLAALLARLMDFAIASFVLILVMIFFRMPVFTSAWLYLPLILLTQLTLMLGLGLASSALNVFFRDIRHVINLGMQLWFFATPIIYPITLVPENLRTIYYLNPMTGIIQAYRLVLLYSKPPDEAFLFSVFVAIIALAAGYWFFKRLEFRFADVI